MGPQHLQGLEGGSWSICNANEGVNYTERGSADNQVRPRQAAQGLGATGRSQPGMAGVGVLRRRARGSGSPSLERVERGSAPRAERLTAMARATAPRVLGRLFQGSVGRRVLPGATPRNQTLGQVRPALHRLVLVSAASLALPAPRSLLRRAGLPASARAPRLPARRWVPQPNPGTGGPPGAGAGTSGQASPYARPLSPVLIPRGSGRRRRARQSAGRGGRAPRAAPAPRGRPARAPPADGFPRWALGLPGFPGWRERDRKRCASSPLLPSRRWRYRRLPLHLSKWLSGEAGLRRVECSELRSCAKSTRGDTYGICHNDFLICFPQAHGTGREGP